MWTAHGMRAILKAFAQLDLWAGQATGQTKTFVKRTLLLGQSPWTGQTSSRKEKFCVLWKRARKANLNIKIIKIQHENVLSFLLFAGQRVSETCTVRRYAQKYGGDLWSRWVFTPNLCPSLSCPVLSREDENESSKCENYVRDWPMRWPMSSL